MKELDIPLKEGEKIEIVDEQQEKKHVTFLGSKRVIPGLTLWEYNKITCELKKAEFVKQTVEVDFSDIKGNTLTRDKVAVKENCYYFQKLNRANAERHMKSYGLPVI